MVYIFTWQQLHRFYSVDMIELHTIYFFWQKLHHLQSFHHFHSVDMIELHTIYIFWQELRHRITNTYWGIEHGTFRLPVRSATRYAMIAHRNSISVEANITLLLNYFFIYYWCLLVLAWGTRVTLYSQG